MDQTSQYLVRTSICARSKAFLRSSIPARLSENMIQGQERVADPGEPGAGGRSGPSTQIPGQRVLLSGGTISGRRHIWSSKRTGSVAPVLAIYLSIFIHPRQPALYCFYRFSTLPPPIYVKNHSLAGLALHVLCYYMSTSKTTFNNPISKYTEK